MREAAARPRRRLSTETRAFERRECGKHERIDMRRLLRRACGRAAPPPAPRVIDVSQIPADAQHTVELEDHVDGRTAPLPKAALLSAASEPGDPSFVVVI